MRDRTSRLILPKHGSAQLYKTGQGRSVTVFLIEDCSKCFLFPVIQSCNHDRS